MTVYDNSNFRGRSLLILQQNAGFRNDYFNDRVDSLKISGSCDWILYKDDDFLGTSYLYEPGDYSTLAGVSNVISSARALPPSGTVAILLYQHSDFRGRQLALSNSETSLVSRDFNDQISSFIITGGSWTLYRHTNFNGQSATFGPGKYTISDLGGAGGNDQVSSVRRN